MNWRLSHRFDKAALPIADAHYNRQKPGSAQFVPPGRCLVLTCTSGTALWVTSWPFPEFTKHAWRGAWVNSAFRRESGPLASELIREALAATLWFYLDPPRIICPYCAETIAMVTFIDREKVRHKRDFGRCYIRAGFRRCADTKGGLLAVHMATDSLPSADEPINGQYSLYE